MTHDGSDLLEMVRRELAPTEGANRFVQLVSEGRLPVERLAAVAGEEYWIGESDRRSFLYLAARFPEAPAVDFFLGLAAVENPARIQLLRYAAALGLGEQDLQAYEQKPGCQAYASHVAWLAKRRLSRARSELRRVGLILRRRRPGASAPLRPQRRRRRIL
jgi:hypothetical protein